MEWKGKESGLPALLFAVTIRPFGNFLTVGKQPRNGTILNLDFVAAC